VGEKERNSFQEIGNISIGHQRASERWTREIITFT
jgi:hypothetical protein